MLNRVLSENLLNNPAAEQNVILISVLDPIKNFGQQKNRMNDF
jgi:hypothetical protein